MLQYEGVWCSTYVLIPHAIGSTTNSTTDLVIFVAIGKSPESGLDGVLSTSITPLTLDFKDVSLMAHLEDKYNWNTVYISYIFPKRGEIFTGYIKFSTEIDNLDEFTYGGQTDIED